MDCHISYRNTNPLGSSSDTDSDSNDETDVWKRSSSKKVQDDDEVEIPTENRLKVPSITAASVPTGLQTRKRKINNVWCNVLQEQTVMDDLVQIGLEKKPDGQNRSCENYDFTRKYLDPRREVDMDTGESSLSGGESNEYGKKKIQKLTDGTEMDAECDDTSVSQSKHHFNKNYLDKKFPKLSPADTEVACKIVRRLSEKKHYLIYRIVHFVGADKAMELLKMTEDVEEQGGLLIKNNSRRRTPGGVYLQLLKTDKNVTQEQIDKVFACEIPYDQLKEVRKAQKKLLKKKHKHRKKKKKTEDKEMVEDEEVVAKEPEAVCETTEAAVEDDTGSESIPSPELNEQVSLENTIVAEVQQPQDEDIEEGEIIDS